MAYPGGSVAKLYATVRQCLTRLAGDVSGNILTITAASIIPILLLVGGAVDMSRAYMTQTSLQAACDAGALAGRRAMSQTGTYGDAEKAKAATLFNFNFHGNSAGAVGTVYDTSSDGNGVVSGTATTQLPTALMYMFGFRNFALTAHCQAEMNIANIDVMFVLDTTASMYCTSAQGSTCSYTNATQPNNSKMHGMQQAVADFYTTVATAVTDPGNSRIRFGFVPFASTVNASYLVSQGVMPASYVSDSTPYQTRIANFTTPGHTTGPGSKTTTTNNPNGYNAGNCPIGATISGTTLTSYALTQSLGWPTSTTYCTQTVTTNVTANGKYTLTGYTYQQLSLNTASFKAGGSVPVVTAIAANATLPGTVCNNNPSGGCTYNMVELAGISGATGLTITNAANSTWAGCIEERQPRPDLSVDPLTADSTDLDINSAPTNAASSWHPYWPAVEYDWAGSSTANPWTSSTAVSPVLTAGIPNGDNCLSASTNYMMPFTVVDTSSPNTVPGWLSAYISGLQGYYWTYHDIGMIWGARLASPHGINAANVNARNAAGNVPQVSRHIIYLTDGEIETAMSGSRSPYSAWGLEELDHRIAPAGTSATTLDSDHSARFVVACNAAKAEGYTIWVIGFGTSLTQPMQNCATAGRAFQASDNATLDSTFRTIAAQIADLRLRS